MTVILSTASEEHLESLGVRCWSSGVEFGSWIVELWNLDLDRCDVAFLFLSRGHGGSSSSFRHPSQSVGFLQELVVGVYWSGTNDKLRQSVLV